MARYVMNSGAEMTVNMLVPAFRVRVSRGLKSIMMISSSDASNGGGGAGVAAIHTHNSNQSVIFLSTGP